jgi:hypothetical protein
MWVLLQPSLKIVWSQVTMDAAEAGPVAAPIATKATKAAADKFNLIDTVKPPFLVRRNRNGFAQDFDGATCHPVRTS